MKWGAKGIAVSGLVAVAFWIGGCKHEPNPPTEQDAIAVWTNINKRPPLPNGAELVSLRKTNGQMAAVTESCFIPCITPPRENIWSR
jgi:hypothetical protein